MMSESKAWEYLAKKWDKAVKGELLGASYLAPIAPRYQAMGLCQSVKLLHITGRISEDTRYGMFDHLNEYADEERDGDMKRFFWATTTKAGAKSRAAFCRRMVKKLSKETLCGMSGLSAGPRENLSDIFTSSRTR